MFGWFKKKQRVTVAQILGMSPAAGMKKEALEFSKDGYEKNTIVFRCVDIIAKSIADIPVKITKKGDPKQALKNHPVGALLARPNVMQSYREFVQDAVAYRLITGTSFIESLGPAPGAKPVELWPWTPFYMGVLKTQDSNTRLPSAWRWDNGKDKKTWLVDQLDGASDMLAWKTFNPRNPYFGLSPLNAAAVAVDRHNAGGWWNHQLLKNYCAPPGALTTEHTLTDDQIAQLKKEISESQSGADNARKPLLLQGGLQWVTMALNPAEMDWLEGLNISGREIAGAFGVPTQVIPIQGDQTFANYEQARMALWEDTVIPLAGDLFGSLTHFLSKYGYPEFEIHADLDNVAALATRRAEKFTSISNAQFLTTNEKRESLGWPRRPEPEADIVFIPAGVVPLTFEAEGETTGDGKLPDAPAGNAALDGVEVVQDTALNGAQVTSLVGIITQVSQGQLPGESARQIIRQAFPAMDEAAINAMVSAAEKFKPKPQEGGSNAQSSDTRGEEGGRGAGGAGG